MKYTIFSIDDSRRAYKVRLHHSVPTTWKYIVSDAVNGAVPDQLQAQIDKHGYNINWDSPRVGHLGIWYTVLNALDHAPLITFEDDALLGQNFGLNWRMRYSQLPPDTDFFSLFLPRDSDHLYNESLSVSSMLTRTYQRYGGVSMYYTKQGAQKIKALLRRDGLTGQYDDTLYRYSSAGELNGYCSKPEFSDLVYITGYEKSIVQESEVYAG